MILSCLLVLRDRCNLVILIAAVPHDVLLILQANPTWLLHIPGPTNYSWSGNGIDLLLFFICVFLSVFQLLVLLQCYLPALDLQYHILLLLLLVERDTVLPGQLFFGFVFVFDGLADPCAGRCPFNIYCVEIPPIFLVQGNPMLKGISLWAGEDIIILDLRVVEFLPEMLPATLDEKLIPNRYLGRALLLLPVEESNIWEVALCSKWVGPIVVQLIVIHREQNYYLYNVMRFTFTHISYHNTIHMDQVLQYQQTYWMERARFTGKDITNLPASYLPNESNIGRVKRNYSYISQEKKPESRARSNASQLQRKKTEVESQAAPKKHISESALLATVDQQLIPDYLPETLLFMRQQQKKTTQARSSITGEQRSRLLQTLFDLHYRFKMFPRTLFAIVSMLDRYLAKKRTVKDQDLTAVGVAILFLCAKYEQTYQVPYLKQVVSLTGGECSVDKVVEMEADVIQTLQFQMITSTAFTFYEPYAKLIGLELKNYHLGHYLLQLSMLHDACLSVPASLLAASTIYLIKKIRKTQATWTQDMSTLVQYSQSELKSTAKILCALLEVANDVDGGRVTRKKFSSPQYLEVTKIRLERREKK